MTVLKSSAWRAKFKVHPAADVFPMMLGKQRDKFVEDIKTNGLKEPIEVRRVDGKLELLDGRNRLEAMELAGITPSEKDIVEIDPTDPVAYIISANIHRRHLNKQQQVKLIITAREAAELLDEIEASEATDKPRNDCEVSEEPDLEPDNKGGRGKKNKLKADVVADAKALGISQRTVELAMQKKKKPKKKPKAKSGKPIGLEEARRHYLDRCRIELGADDIEAEKETIAEALDNIASKLPAGDMFRDMERDLTASLNPKRRTH